MNLCLIRALLLVATSGSACVLSRPPPEEGAVSVVVAARDLSVGTPIGADDVVVVDRRLDPSERNRSFDSRADVLGRTPREPIFAGEPVRDERLGRPDAGVGLQAIVTPGMRAITLSLRRSGLLRPGSRIDLRVGPLRECPGATGLLQDLRVLAVDGSMEAPRARERSWFGAPEPEARAPEDRHDLTIEVTPRDALVVAAADAIDAIVVLLRSDVDPWPASGVAPELPECMRVASAPPGA